MENKKTRGRKLLITLVLMIGLTGFFYGFQVYSKSETSYQFDTVSVQKGSICNTVTATGTLEAINTVVVGTQVSGVIEKIYVDYNSVVKKGQLIAEIDKSTLKSTLKTAEADLEKALAEADYRKAVFKRMQVVHEKGMLSESDFDLARYNYRTSLASVQSAEANVEIAQRNLSYAMIYSPIDGVVLDTAYEEGQTLAASTTTPELFTIANNLREMQVEVNVDEADIGMVKEGQRVEFTVDAFPEDIFNGTVTQVRLQSTETSNVITYTVIVSAHNPDLKLKPGMTASITDYVEEITDVLTLAGKALRFSPSPDILKNIHGDSPDGAKPRRREVSSGASEEARPTARGEDESSENTKQVWVENGGHIHPVPVQVGKSDGTLFQIISGLKEGDIVITAMKEGSIDKDKTKLKNTTQTSPFVQQQGPGGPK